LPRPESRPTVCLAGMGHHFSTDLARRHPQLDLTDVYAFESDVARKTCMILVLNPKSTAGDPNNFSGDAIYKLHLGADKLHRSGRTYTVRFHDAVAILGLLDQSDNGAGIAGREVGVAHLNQITHLPGEMRFWAGTVKDPFFGNQNGLRELREAFAKGDLDLHAFVRHAGESPFRGIVSSAIVLEVPNEFLPPTIYYFASVDWRDQGHWHRANRVAYVLVPHLYLFSTTDEQRSSRHEHLPALDVEYRAVAAATIENYTRLAGFQNDPSRYARSVAETILPDAVPYRVGSKAHYGVEGANGRRLSDDAMDAALSWIVGVPVNDGVDQPEGTVLQAFPFVVPPT
jgi:hypothetical protein